MPMIIRLYSVLHHKIYLSMVWQKSNSGISVKMIESLLSLMKYLVQSIHVNLDPRINVSENLSQKVSHESNAFQGKCMSNIVQHYFNLGKNIINCLTLLVCNLNKTSCYNNSGRN